jgi:signal transduction histidine kinase
LRDADVLARMTSNLVHDMRNLVNPLALYLQLLERQIERDNVEAHASLSEMNEVVRQSIRVLERLRDFSLQSPSKPVEPADLAAVLGEVTAAARAQVPHGGRVEIVLERAAVPPLVRADRRGLAEALSALLSNAVDAVAAGGGTVTVRTSWIDGVASVQVSDDGPGMSPTVADRAFEPLFTTKGVLGAGLGLSNVYAFARRCGGTVALSTKAGEGTTVVLQIPVADPLALHG